MFFAFDGRMKCEAQGAFSQRIEQRCDFRINSASQNSCRFDIGYAIDDVSVLWIVWIGRLRRDRHESGFFTRKIQKIEQRAIYVVETQTRTAVTYETACSLVLARFASYLILF